jgi:hypothetical protein
MFLEQSNHPSAYLLVNLEDEDLAPWGCLLQASQSSISALQHFLPNSFTFSSVAAAVILLSDS